MNEIILTPLSSLPFQLSKGDFLYLGMSFPHFFWVTTQNGIPFKLRNDDRQYGRACVSVMKKDDIKDWLSNAKFLAPDLKLTQKGENPVAMWWQVS